jgi:hypothetical protein
MMIPDDMVRNGRPVSQTAQVVYHHSQMRRTLAIFLVLLFSLAPLAAALDTSTGSDDDARLPACCRRHGAHHCEMSAQTAALLATAASGRAIAIAPTTCPAFPTSLAATVSAPQALAAGALRMPQLLAQFHSAVASRAAARISQFCTRGDRGPPQPVLA